jgi:hypothetical protein
MSSNAPFFLGLNGLLVSNARDDHLIILVMKMPIFITWFILVAVILF